VLDVGQVLAMRRVYFALFGFVIASAAVHALVGFWTPIQGDDWNHWIWAGRHRDQPTGGWLAAFASSHFTFSELSAYLLARCRLLHAILTPVAYLSLVVGMFVLAMRRLPRATWHDLVGLMLSSALLWLAQPSAGITLFYTASVGYFVYGSAIAVWFAAPFRCGWSPRRAWWPVLAIAGYAIGTSTRVIATATLIGVLYFAFRKRRETWMWFAVGGLVIGTLVGYINPPWLEFTRVIKRGFEPNLVGVGLVKFMVEEGGEVVSLVAALVLTDVVARTFGRPHASVEGRPDPTDSLLWFGAWFVASIWCLFGPRYNEYMLLPASCMIVIGALPYMTWLFSSRLLQVPLIVLAVGVHLIAWSFMIKNYYGYGREGAERLAAFEQAKPGTTVFVKRLSLLTPDFWFMGEDLAIARQRQLVAIDGFGLRDIVFVDPFRRLDSNPGIELALEVDGVSEAELQAARVPPFWATELAAGRKQFELFVQRLRNVTGRAVSARLAVKNVPFPQAGDRPLLAAWSDHEGVMIPRTQRSSIDPNVHITTRIYRPEALQFKEAWVIENDVATEIQYHGGSPMFQPKQASLDVTIACNPKRCLAIDALRPRF
jgi:hypothetical protein